MKYALFFLSKPHPHAEGFDTGGKPLWRGGIAQPLGISPSYLIAPRQPTHFYSQPILQSARFYSQPILQSVRFYVKPKNKISFLINPIDKYCR